MKDPKSKNLDSRRDALEDKLAARAKALEAEEAKNNKESDQTGMARGLKIASEFVAGIIVGAGLGWLIDQGLGTTPWCFIVFLMLGFAAGGLGL